MWLTVQFSVECVCACVCACVCVCACACVCVCFCLSVSLSLSLSISLCVFVPLCAASCVCAGYAYGYGWMQAVWACEMHEERKAMCEELGAGGVLHMSICMISCISSVLSFLFGCTYRKCELPSTSALPVPRTCSFFTITFVFIYFLIFFVGMRGIICHSCPTNPAEDVIRQETHAQGGGSPLPPLDEDGGGGGGAKNRC